MQNENDMAFADYINSINDDELLSKQLDAMGINNSKTVCSDGKDEYIYAKIITGVNKLIKKDSVVGYCHCDKHRGCLSVHLINEHDCINKNCFYFEKRNDRYWKMIKHQKEQARIAKKKGKERNKALKREEEKRLKMEQDIRDAIQKLADKMDHQIKITSVKKLPRTKHFIVFYISHEAKDDSYKYRDLALTYGYMVEGKAEFRHVKELDGSYAVI